MMTLRVFHDMMTQRFVCVPAGFSQQGKNRCDELKLECACQEVKPPGEIQFQERKAGWKVANFKKGRKDGSMPAGFSQQAKENRQVS